MRVPSALLMALVVLLGAPAAHSQEPTILQAHCQGNAVESCYIVLQGVITNDVANRFEKSFARSDAPTLYLDSLGGDLGAALRLGRLVRAAGLQTMLGAPVPDALKNERAPFGGRCESACAYVFMGGVKRHLGEGDTLGLHRFWVEGAQIDGESAQVISGQLVTYMIEMNVDPRVFRLASQMGRDEMYQIGPEEAAEYDLVTSFGYGPLFMEPWNNGVIASAKRLDPTGAYDTARQITFYCRGGDAYALISADGMGLDRHAADSPPRITLDGTQVEGGGVSVRSTNDTDYIAIQLPKQIASALPAAQEVNIGVWWGRAMAGERGVWLRLSEMDREMIRAAFRFCID